MKKRWLLIFLIFVVVGLLLACGSGGGQEDSTPTPPPTPTTPSIKEDGFASIPDSEYTESIVIAINASVATSYPDWQIKAQAMLDEVNTALDRSAGNKKQFTIARFMTYPDADLKSMFNNYDSNYFFDNGYDRHAGTTVFFYLYDGVANKPDIFSPTATAMYKSQLASDGRYLGGAWIAYDIAWSPLTNLTAGTSGYKSEMNGFFEELGHSMGLAAEEWYRYNGVVDWTGTLPILNTYNRFVQFPNDPMCSVPSTPEFAPFNSWLINKNANHQYTLVEITQGIPDVIKVKVVDSADNPISGATVKVFAALWRSVPVTDPVLLLSTTTDVNGEAVINSDDANTSTYGSVTYAHKFSRMVSAKIIKVESGGKVAGAFLTLTDLEIAFLQDGLNTLTVELIPE